MSDIVEFPPSGSRLAGMDGLQLHIETDRSPMHTLKIFLLDALAGEQPLEVGDVVAALRRTAETFRFFRVVAVPATLGIDQPRWWSARDVDLDDHIKLGTVPAPGGRREFDATVGALTESRLPSDRPLWKAWILDGLVDGRIAVVVKLHHALADGVAAANQLSMITSFDVWPAPDDDSTPIPSRRKTLAHAVRERAERLRELPALVMATRNAVRDVRAFELPALGIPGPHNRFRGALSPGRSFATTSLRLEDVRYARAAAPGATINDVMLSLVGGAVRSVLRARDELPARTLLTVVPVSTDPRDAPARLWGNGFSLLFTALGTDIDHPIERLRAIHETTAGRKRVQHRLGDLSARWIDQIPPMLVRGSVVAATRLRLTGHVPLPGISVSNVRGPAGRIRLPQWGFEIAELYSVGPVSNGTGLNITAWSYDGTVQIVALTDSSLLSDAHEVTGAMAAELERLIAAVRSGDSARAQSQS